MAALFVSSAVPQDPGGSWVENGTQLVWQYEPVYMMPDNAQMMMNAVIVMNIACGGPDCSSTAPPEANTYTPPAPGGGPVGPGNVPLTPNQPPPPPEQPPPPPPVGCCVYGTALELPFLSNAGSASDAIAYACSSDGSIICGVSYQTSSNSLQPVYWTSTTLPPTLLPLLMGDIIGQCITISGDGSILAGFTSDGTHNHPVKWAAGVVTELGFLAGTTEGRASGISEDGQTIVGWVNPTGGNTEPCYWPNGGTTATALPLLAGGTAGQAVACSNDASIIVGNAIDGSAQQHAVYWHFNGVSWLIVDLGFLPSGTFSAANACSGDGTVIGGRSFVSGQFLATKWVNGVITELGWQPGSDVLAVSSDGTTLGGIYTSSVPVTECGGNIQFMQAPDVTDGNFGIVYAISRDNEVAVGYSNGSTVADHALRWHCTV